ncbi:MAG: response regulator [Clostridiales Family XIII bacterium]|nr:response regulator [Clostridiales Family XIII bacterium]
MMNRNNPTFHSRTFAVLIICLAVPLVASWYIVQYLNKDIFYDQKSDSLIAVARMLDTQLGEDGYDGLLKEAGAENAAREEKIAVLNKALRGVTDDVASVGKGLGVGFYSRELDAILTYGPSAEFAGNVGRSIAGDHPGREVMATDTSMVQQGTMIRGDIMNAMIPVERGGEVIGYIWANELISDLEGALNRTSTTITALLLIAYIIMIGVVVVFFRRLMRIERDARITVEEAREEALAGTHAKSAFLSSMSHEMRTPLNAIIGMTSIAEGSDNIEQKDYCLGKIDEASEHLLGVINDILDISKIEADRFELSEEEFSFEHMLQKVVNVMGFRVDKNHQKFFVHVDEDIPDFLFGDDQRIAQVVTNLLGNSAKFTPEGGTIELDAKLLVREDNVCTLEITVKDNGIGIDSDKQAHLFQPFTQEDSSTVRKYGGTGLGLAISKRIVEMMDGNIWVESEKGKGSIFGFTVKLKIGPHSHDIPEPDIPPWEALRVFVVDEDPDQQDYFERVGKHLGFGELCLARSGEEACEAIRKEAPFDIYFVDWNVQGMSGLEVTKYIKAADPGHRVVIMISTAELSRAQVDARQAGADAFIEKPVFTSNIVDLLNEFFGSERAVQSANEDTADCFKGHRILLVEDIDINREIVLALLEPTGLDIECAGNGLEAVEMFKAGPQRYEMIFMDIHMPEMDGYEATRQIRALPGKEAKETPIIAMTANVFREDIEKCMDAGMNGHVGKPLNMDDVMAKLRQYLRHEDAANPLSSQTD